MIHRWGARCCRFFQTIAKNHKFSQKITNFLPTIYVVVLLELYDSPNIVLLLHCNFPFSKNCIVLLMDLWRSPKPGYFECKKCDLCKWSLFGGSVTNSASNMRYKIQKSLNCNSKFVIYIYFCSMGSCKELPYVRRADNLKTRHSNHKSHVKKSYKSCKLTEHIILNHGGVLDQNKLKVTAIDSIENIDPPEDCVNIAKWRENKLEQLEE